METNERSGASAPGRIEIFPEFGPEQTIFELREAKKKTVLENIDEALRFAFELGYKARIS